MNPDPYPTDDRNLHESMYDEVERQHTIRKRFSSDVVGMIGSMVVVLAINIFLTGYITWARFPLFFMSIFIFTRFIKYIRAKRYGEDYPGRSRRQRRRNRNTYHEEEIPVEDYSEELLRHEEREKAELKDYRQPGKLWKDEDLV